MNNIPTIQTLYNSILAKLEAELQVSIPVFGKVFLRAFAAVLAGTVKLFYLSVASLQKNLFVDTADRESAGGTLERFGRAKLGRDPFPAKQGQYTITVTGSVGATIDASTTFKSNDDAQNPGKLFVLDEAYELVATTDTITVRALEAGLDSQLYVDELLTATQPINGVEATAAVAAETVAPEAEEDIEDYRTKALKAYRTETQGGASGDYRVWSYGANGVQEVYPYAKSGATGEVDLFVEATIAASTDGKGTPSAGLLEDVEEVVELDPDTTLPMNERSRRPLGAFAVNVQAVSIKEIDITIVGFAGVTVEQETIIEEALTEYIATVRPFIAAVDVLAERNEVLSVNRIISTILTAVPGAQFTNVQLQVASQAVSSYSFIDGNIPHLNSVVYA